MPVKADVFHVQSVNVLVEGQGIVFSMLFKALVRGCRSDLCAPPCALAPRAWNEEKIAELESMQSGSSCSKACFAPARSRWDWCRSTSLRRPG